VEQQGNHLVLECEPGLSHITTDRAKLQQVLVNLLGNAGKFTTQGTISLTASRRGTDGVDVIRIRVKDTGIGIEPADHARIFQVFTQAEGSTARKYGGTGLGLTISRQLARMLGGDLTVESAPGIGSTFEMSLPAEPSADDRAGQ
jgi:signal transduction histidine kinase